MTTLKAAIGLVALALVLAVAPAPNYQRDVVRADPQHLAGDIDNHVILQTTLPSRGWYLVTANVNLKNAHGPAEVWLFVDGLYRQPAVITVDGFAYVAFPAEYVRGGAVVGIDLRAGMSLDIGPDTQIVYTRLP